MVRPRKFFGIPQSSSCSHTNVEKHKIWQINAKSLEICRYDAKCVIFEICVVLTPKENSSELENIWQFSDGLSKKIFWNPAELFVLKHRSQKNFKMWQNYAKMVIKYRYICMKCVIFDFCILLAPAENSSKLENIWQISDFLSRKNYSDPAEHLMPAHKCPKFEIWQNHTRMVLIY